MDEVHPPEAQPEGTDQKADGSPTTGRVVLAVVLFVFAAAIVVVIFWLKSDSLPLNASLVTTAAVLAGSASVVLPLKVRNRSVPFVAVAGGTAGLLAAVLAIPGLSAPQPTAQETPDSEPITWNLDFNQPGDNCEKFLVKDSLLKLLPAGDDLNAEWVYKHGGATTTTEALLTVQGKSEDAVALRKLRIIEVQMEDVPRGAAVLWPCNTAWQPIPARHYKVYFGRNEGQLIQAPGVNGKGRTIDPIKPLPVQVTNSHTEVFRFELTPMEPVCLCSWKLEIEWSSGDRKGKTIIDRGFGSIRTAPHLQHTDVKTGYFREGDGSWRPMG